MNWKFVHSVWSLVWHPRKTSPGVQTLCIAIFLAIAAPALAETDAPISDPRDGGASCTQQSEILTAVQRQVADTAVVRYLLAEVLRSIDEIKRNAALNSSLPNHPSSPSSPSVQEGR